MMCKSCDGVQAQKEEVLHDDRCAGKPGSCERGGPLDPRPGEVYIEQKEKNSQTND
jgi:hypothetical protein